jgi:serine/threonine protein kinase/tetratricopeptide (TPR) repeat protein
MAAKKTNPEEIFHKAIDISDHTERAAYLDKACKGDEKLQAEVEILLKSHEEAGDFLEIPPIDPDVTLDESPITEGPETVIGRYKLLEKIGEGGMASVYMAEQKQPIRRRVALKIIKLGMDTKSVIARFEAERQALAMMDHPNIAKVLDAGTTDTGRPYFVMELVRGVSITEFCDKNNLNTRERLGLFVSVCQAVQHAHQKGIIHRDIKPSNVMVTLHDGEPVPKVIDFGIAKAVNQQLTEKTVFTRYAQMIGTPEYMSPEQAEMSGLDVDIRTDVFSLGVLLYELLTGTTPFDQKYLLSKGYAEMQRIIREEEPTRPSTKISTLGEALIDIAKHRQTSPDLLQKLIRTDLDWIVMKTLEKDRSRRYDSVSEFVADIKRHLNHEPVLAGRPSTLYRIKKFVQRRRALVASAIIVAAVIIVGFIVSTVMYFQAEQARKKEALARKKEEQARSEAQNVADFLTDDLLASVYPEKAKSPEVTVRYVLKAAEENLESKFEENPLAEAKIRQTLGLTYQKLADFQAAESHLQRALEIHRQQLGEDDPSTLASLSYIGDLYIEQGRYSEAEPLLIKTLEDRSRVLGEVHPDTISSMCSLGWCYTFQGRFDSAEVLFIRVMDVGNKVLGEEHSVVLNAIQGCSVSYLSKQQPKKAEPLSHKGFEISRRVMGEEHELTLYFMNDLAWAYEMQDRYDEAQELSIKALEISQRVVGEEHPTTIQAMSMLGWTYVKQGQVEKGAPLVIKSVELSRRVLGEEHLHTLFFMLRLIELYGLQGQDDERDTLLIKNLEISNRIFGSEHALTSNLRWRIGKRIDDLSLLAKEYYKTHEYQNLITTLTHQDELNQAVGVEQNPSDLALLVMSLHHLGQNQEAQIALNRLRQMYDQDEHIHDEKHLSIAERLLASQNSVTYQLWNLIENGELDEASKKLNSLKTSLGDRNNDTNLLSVKKALARAYYMLGKDAETLNKHEDAYMYYKKAVDVHQSYPLVINKVAWFLATHPIDKNYDSARAIELAKRACELTNWKKPLYLSTLAAAYSVSEDFNSAIKWQKQANGLFAKEGPSMMQADWELRLKLYQSNKPYRRRLRRMIGWWKLDGNALDSSGHENHGIQIGEPIYVSGIKDQALKLQGNGDHVLIPEVGNLLNGLDALTVCLWIKPNKIGTDKGFIIFEDPQTHDRRGMRYDKDGSTGGGSNLIKVGITSTGGHVHVESSDNTQTTTWQHLAITWSSGTIPTLFINGMSNTPKWTEPAQIGTLIGYTKMMIGKGGKDTDKKDSWSGLIDDVRIYNYALTEAEIKDLYDGKESVTTDHRE